MSRRFTLLSNILSVFALLLSIVPQVAAADYNVSASVDFPPPSQAAVFTNSPDGQTVNSASLTLTGTCEALTPNGVVSIWRGGISIGSGPCNGSFNIVVVLTEGVNTLIARSSSVSAQYGPDSTPVTVTLELPPTVNPPTPVPAPGTNTPATPVSINAGAARQLTARPSQPFGLMNTVTNEVALEIIVEGGSNPYTIMINWGDGSEETKVIDQLGTYRFTHIYAKPGTYTVKGVVRDVLGTATTFEYAVVSEKAAPQPENSTDISKPAVPAQDSGNWLWLWLLILLSLLLVAIGYGFGWLAAKRRKPKRRPKPAAKKRRKQ